MAILGFILLVLLGILLLAFGAVVLFALAYVGQRPNSDHVVGHGFLLVGAIVLLYALYNSPVALVVR